MKLCQTAVLLAFGLALTISAGHAISVGHTILCGDCRGDCDGVCHPWSPDGGNKTCSFCYIYPDEDEKKLPVPLHEIKDQCGRLQGISLAIGVLFIVAAVSPRWHCHFPIP